MTEEVPLRRRTLSVVKPEHGGTIISLNLSTLQVALTVFLSAAAFFGVLYSATRIVFQPLIDERIQVAQKAQDDEIKEKYATEAQLRELKTEKDERWAAQYRLNQDLAALLSEMRADIKVLLGRR